MLLLLAAAPDCRPIYPGVTVGRLLIDIATLGPYSIAHAAIHDAMKRDGEAGKTEESRAARVSSASRGRVTRRPVVSNAFRLGYLIHDVSRMRRTIVDQHMKPEGITRSQWWVLANLSRQGGDGLVSTELARLMDVGKVTLGGLIDRLEVAGYIYRRKDKDDHRVKRIFISQSGYALIERMRPIIERLNARITEGLTQAHVKETEHHLIQMKDNLRSLLLEAGEDIGVDL